MKKPTQGEFHWQIEYADGMVVDKEEDGGKINTYHHVEKGNMKRDGIKHFGLVDSEGLIAAQITNVPADAVPFYRRRKVNVNFFHQTKQVTIQNPEEIADKWTPKVKSRINAQGQHEWYYPATSVTVVKPDVAYEWVYLIGWRRRKPNGTIEVKLKAVYPDGTVKDHNGFGEEEWLYEPEWFSEEQV